MARTPLHSAALVGLGLFAGTVATSVWLYAQDAAPRKHAAQEQLEEARQQLLGPVYSGNDIAFRVVGRNGRAPVVVPVVKLNGEWVEVEFGGGGIRKLTQ